MCFKNLPVSIDEAGVATLVEGAGNPYALEGPVRSSFTKIDYGDLENNPQVKDWMPSS